MGTEFSCKPTVTAAPRAELFRILRCPCCGGRLSPASGSQWADGFGTLACSCERYPVVAGIPVLKKEKLAPTGETARDLCRLIKSGRTREALLILVAPACANGLVRRGLIKLLDWPYARRLGQSVRAQAVARRRREFESEILNHAGTSFRELVRAVGRFCGPEPDEAEHYAIYRFSIPRHLVALSLMNLIPETPLPLLEFGCGFGHLTFSAQRGGRRAVGLDHSFFSLVLAQRFLAPGAEFVCADGERSLPFEEGAFGGVLVCDALHYVQGKAGLVREFTRVAARDAPVLMGSIRNSLVRQMHDCLSISPAGCHALAADKPHRLMGDGEILRAYLRREGVPIQRQCEDPELAGEPLLSLVIAPDALLNRAPFAFERWPHARGRLGVNPLYCGEECGGRLILRRRFPSAFFEAENAECRGYLPEMVPVPPGATEALRDGVRTPEVEDLAARFALLDLPESY